MDRTSLGLRAVLGALYFAGAHPVFASVTAAASVMLIAQPVFEGSEVIQGSCSPAAGLSATIYFRSAGSKLGQLALLAGGVISLLYIPSRFRWTASGLCFLLASFPAMIQLATAAYVCIVAR